MPETATIVEAAAVLLCPLALGVLAGELVQSLIGRRIAGAAAGAMLVILPTLVAAAVTVWFPIVGLWDGATEGLLCGAGLLFSAHRLYADRRDVLLTVGGVLASCLVLEVAVRLFLGAPPAYPVGDGPHLLLATFLRTKGPDSPLFQVGEMPELLERDAMQGDIQGRTMADRPPGAMVTKEIVCSIAYGAAYSGVVDVSRERSAVFPDDRPPNPTKTKHVLHIGDSMVYGAGVARNQTFVAHLGETKPEVEHVNAGVSGTAPDDYFVIMRSWLGRRPFDLVVMYLFEGNDLTGLDAPHPCSNWESILSYEGDRVGLRFPGGPKSEHRIGLKWLVVNSPLPYLGRVMIVCHSRLAAFLGGLLDAWSVRAASGNGYLLLPHLESILHAARDQLRAEHIRFLVVMLPSAMGLENPDDPLGFGKKVRDISQRLGLHELDATEPILAALARGEHPFQDDHTHFNEAGHRMMAQWLDQELAAIADAPID